MNACPPLHGPWAAIGGGRGGTRPNRAKSRPTRAARPLLLQGAEVAMNVLVEITAVLAGVAVGVGAARLFLGGLLAFAFRSR